MKTKIFYGNQYIGSTRVTGERYTLKQRLVRFIKRTIILSALVGLVSGVIVGTYKLGGTLNPVISYAEKIVDTSDLMLDEKILGLKNGVVDKLQACESAGHKETDGIIIFDSNKKASIGQLQFQVATVQYYYKTLYNKTITQKEAVIIALDTPQARDLARDVMFNTKNMASKDWYNCEKRHNLDAQIAIIKAL